MSQKYFTWGMKSSSTANKWWYCFNSSERATHNKIINILHWGRIHQSNKCCVVGVKDADWKHFSSQFSLTLHYDTNSYLNPRKILEALHCSPRSGELRTQKLKSHLVRTQSWNVLPFKPGVGQYIAIHATLTAREFFLAYFYPSSPFTCIFSKTSPNFFLCWPAE